MRVKLSGPVEVIETFETTVQSTPGASLKQGLKRLEPAELRFGIVEAGAIVVVVKDLAELVGLCWSGIQALRMARAKPMSNSREAPDPVRVAAAGEPASIAIEITTAATHIRIAVPLDATREQIEKQLAPLQTGRAQ